MSKDKKLLSEQLHQLADDVINYDNPEHQWEVDTLNGWMDCTKLPDLSTGSSNYRRKPETIIINGFRVLLGLSVTARPIESDTVYVASTASADFYNKIETASFYKLFRSDHRALHRLCYERKEDAILRAKAMIGISPN